MKTLVVIPTYNEIANIESIVDRVRVYVPDADILIVDDGSPEHTGHIAEGLASADHHVNVLYRPAKKGLGAAYLAGFRWGMSREYDVFVEMDADGSHRPEEMHRLLSAVDTGAGLVLGSRWIEGGAVVNWPKHRELLSRGGEHCFQIDLAWRAIAAGVVVIEVPITFEERTHGESKMDVAIVREALIRVTGWGVRHRLGNARCALSPVGMPEAIAAK